MNQTISTSPTNQRPIVSRMFQSFQSQEEESRAGNMSPTFSPVFMPTFHQPHTIRTPMHQHTVESLISPPSSSLKRPLPQPSTSPAPKRRLGNAAVRSPAKQPHRISFGKHISPNKQFATKKKEMEVKKTQQKTKKTYSQWTDQETGVLLEVLEIWAEQLKTQKNKMQTWGLILKKYNAICESEQIASNKSQTQLREREKYLQRKYKEMLDNTKLSGREGPTATAEGAQVFKWKSDMDKIYGDRPIYNLPDTLESSMDALDDMDGFNSIEDVAAPASSMIPAQTSPLAPMPTRKKSAETQKKPDKLEEVLHLVNKMVDDSKKQREEEREDFKEMLRQQAESEKANREGFLEMMRMMMQELKK